MVEWVEVESSNIVAIGSEVGKLDLYVRFNSGSEYVYQDVPEEVVQEFLAADSKGKFFAQSIKNVYAYGKVG